MTYYFIAMGLAVLLASGCNSSENEVSKRTNIPQQKMEQHPKECLESFFIGGGNPLMINLPSRCNASEKDSYLLNWGDLEKDDPDLIFSSVGRFDNRRDANEKRFLRRLTLKNGDIVRYFGYANGGPITPKTRQKLNARFQRFQETVKKEGLKYRGHSSFIPHSDYSQTPIWFHFAPPSKKDHLTIILDNQRAVAVIKLGNTVISPLSLYFGERNLAKIDPILRPYFTLGRYTEIGTKYKTSGGVPITYRFAPEGEYNLLNLPPGMLAPSQNPAVTKDLAGLLTENLLQLDLEQLLH